jgi:hypothetical protein
MFRAKLAAGFRGVRVEDLGSEFGVANPHVFMALDPLVLSVVEEIEILSTFTSAPAKILIPTPTSTSQPVPFNCK